MTFRERAGAFAARTLAKSMMLFYPPSFRRDVGRELVRDLELAAKEVIREQPRTFLPWFARTAWSLCANAASEWTEGPDPRSLSRRGSKGEMNPVDVLMQDLRFAVRALRRRPGFTVVAVFTLALGIGATTAMFSVVRGILLRPFPYPNSERLVTVWESPLEDVGSIEGGLLSHPNYRDVRDEVDGIESIALVNGANLTVTEDGGAELVRGAVVTPGLFGVLQTPLLRGRDFSGIENSQGGPAVVIVNADYWRDRFGELDAAVGSSIRIAGRARQVVGVAPSGFDYPGEVRLWIPAQNDEEGCGRGCVNRGSIARLAGGVALGAVRADLETLALRLEADYPTSNTDTRFALATLHDVTVGDVRPALYLLFGAVGMVLLIACANVANLIIVRGRGRVTEVAVRTTLGAGRRRILKQLMTESGLIALVGGALGLGLGLLGVDLVLALAPPNIPRLDEVGMDLMTVCFAGLLVVVTTLLFGATPALMISRLELTRALGRGGRGNVTGGRTGRAHAMILTVEVALSVLLLVGAGLMVRSFVHTTEVEPGYDLENVAGFRLSLPGSRYSPEARVQFVDRLTERLGALPGVHSAAVFLAPPLGSASVFGGFSRTERPPPEPGEGPAASYRAVGPGALELLGIPIVSGRAFRESDRHDSEPVVIITERTAEQFFPGEDPVGRQIDLQVSTGFDEVGPRTIVGVAGDFRGARLTQAPGSETLVPYAQAGASFPNVLLRGDDPAALLDAARRELRALDPQLPLIRPVRLEALIHQQLAQPRFYLLLLGVLAFLAIILAAVGMYGVIAYAVSQRTKEIGVRMALGAQTNQVVRLVLLQGVRPAIWGLLLGVVGALWAGRLMRGLLYEVAPQDPLTLVVVPVVLSVVVALACAIPARRATRVAPATALRGD